MPVPGAATKASTGDDKTDKTDTNGAGGDSKDATAAAVGQAQAAANPAQPVAAAIVVSTVANIAPAPAPTGTSSAIGDASKPRAKAAPAVAINQGAAAGQKPTAALATVPQTASSAATGAVAEPAKTQAAAQNNAAQQVPAQATDGSDAPQNGDTAPAGAVHPTAPAAVAPSEAAVAPSENAAPAPNQANPGTAKTDLNGLPNFGFPALSATTSSTSTTASAAPANPASAATVPVAGLAVAIAARAQAGSNHFEIRLSPPELGRIDVQLNVDGNGQVTTHMTVERPDTLQLLQSQQPQLQNALEQAGLTTGDNGLQFTLRDQSFTGQNNGSGFQQPAVQLVIPEPDVAPIAATQIYTRAGLGTGVDIRV